MFWWQMDPSVHIQILGVYVNTLFIAKRHGLHKNRVQPPPPNQHNSQKSMCIKPIVYGLMLCNCIQIFRYLFENV